MQVVLGVYYVIGQSGGGDGSGNGGVDGGGSGGRGGFISRYP